jgi:putative Mg2+ transporter-C (MgtC) family protein
MDSIQLELVLLLKLVAAGGLGAAIGLEREQSSKAAGLRTHILVALTSALFVVLNDLWVLEPQAPGVTLVVDPGRAIMAIAVGIGFLGSGIVFLDRNRPRGLTTAASIWATSAIGAACGFSRYILAGGATILVLITLRLIERVELRGRSARDSDE